MNLLNPASIVELLLVLGVLSYVLVRYKQQRDALTALSTQLQTERAALKAAHIHILQAHTVKRAPRDIIVKLAEITPKDSLVGKRLQLLVQHRSRHAEHANAVLTHGPLADAQASRAQAATEDARFWAGAFVFIGLIGTLLCLGVAVFYLMSVVGRAGNSTGMASSLKDVTSNMTGTFMSMGLAFVNTGAGAGLTVMLSGQIGRYEKDAEAFRHELEEFSLLELEPLVAATFVKASEETYLKEIVAQMQNVATTFIHSLEATHQTVKDLGATTATSAGRLESAAATFTAATDLLGKQIGPLNERLNTIGQIVQRQEAAQNTFIANVQTTLQWLEGAVNNADAAFIKLDGFRQDLAKDFEATRSLQMEALQGMQQQGRESGERGQRTFHELKQEMMQGVQAINNSIKEGNEHDEQTVKALREAISTLADYTAHVEDVLRQLPVAIGSEPIITFESNQAEVMGQLSASLTSLGGEISGLRGDVKTTLDGPGSAIHHVNVKMDGVQNDLKRMNGQADTLRSMQDNIAGLTAQMTAINGQLNQMKTTMGRLERSVIFPFGRGQG